MKFKIKALSPILNSTGKCKDICARVQFYNTIYNFRGNFKI